MTLEDALEAIQYSSNWGVWASLDEWGKFAPESQARYGQPCFENGGVLDDYEYFAHGETIQDFLAEEGGVIDLIDNINASLL
jgi:hypothetical protein